MNLFHLYRHSVISLKDKIWAIVKYFLYLFKYPKTMDKIINDYIDNSNVEIFNFDDFLSMCDEYKFKSFEDEKNN